MVKPASVPRTWVGETAVCLATGPSLCQADVDACRGRARVIAVKDAYTMAPWADVAYFCGADRGKWWQHHEAGLRAFEGERYSLDIRAASLATVLKQGPETGLSTDPTTLCTGRNSGYQAINLAVLMGAARILLLGYDLQPATDGREYFFGSHPYTRPPSPYNRFMDLYETLCAPLSAQGVTVLNCSRVSALTCFPRVTLAEALNLPLQGAA